MRDHKTIVPARSPPPPAAASLSLSRFSSNNNGMMGRVLRRFQRATTGTLALVGVGALGYMAWEYQSMQAIRQEDEYREATAANDESSDKKKKKKRVLVLPFHRMKLVETKKPSLSDFASRLSDDNDDRILEVR
jgi:hypothetical protein